MLPKDPGGRSRRSARKRRRSTLRLRMWPSSRFKRSSRDKRTPSERMLILRRLRRRVQNMQWQGRSSNRRMKWRRGRGRQFQASTQCQRMFACWPRRRPRASFPLRAWNKRTPITSLRTRLIARLQWST